MGRLPIIGVLLKVVTYLLLLLLLLTYLSPIVSPEKFPFLSILGLLSPIILFLNIVMMTLWIVSWERIALPCVVVVLLGVGSIARLVQVPIVKQQHPTGKILKVMTYNAHFFTTTDHKDVLRKSLMCIDTLDVGIICFQEFLTSRQDNLPEINRVLKDFPYRYLHSTEDKSSNVSYYSAIYSKYRILNRGELHFNTISNGAIYADILYRNDTIRVFNNHLQSNKVNRDDIKFLSGDGESMAKERGLFRLFSIGKKLSLNDGLRASQADSLNRLITQTPYKGVIVCGDHNAIPISYTYNKVRGDLDDAFVNKGQWYGYTYKQFGQFLRIDYVFHSKQFETVSYSSPSILWSDHKPVIVELKYNRE